MFLELRYDNCEVIKMTFGEKLSYYMSKAGMTQKQLAEAIGVTPTRLNYWVKDKREPDVFYIKALAKALGVTGSELLGIDPPTDVLHISYGSGDRNTDEIRKQLHDLIDEMADEDLRLLQDITLRMKRE